MPPLQVMRLLLCALALGIASGVAAQDAVPQKGERARAAEQLLSHVRLPAGFRIRLYAVVPGARHMAVAPSGQRVFVGTFGDTVWTVDDGDGDGRAEAVRRFAPDTAFQLANGVCLDGDGTLYVADFNQVLAFPRATDTTAGAPAAKRVVVPQGKLVPPDTGTGHGARVCRIGPDGLLYIALGQPHNVPPRDRLDAYNRVGIGGIIRLDPKDGGRRQVHARGIRNSVGIAFHPGDRSLWFTDNQTDRMGDDIPPGEINRATAPGQHFGYPWLGGKSVRITEHGYDRDPLPPDAVPPEVETDAHAADLGLAFYTGTHFPPRYRGGIFSAQHGSWDRSTPIGARVMFTALKADGTAERAEVFAAGWLDQASGRYRGRPVDVAMLPDGSLLVSDDRAGAIYRIEYTGK